jgi:hypothetical protein
MYHILPMYLPFFICSNRVLLSLFSYTFQLTYFVIYMVYPASLTFTYVKYCLYSILYIHCHCYLCLVIHFSSHISSSTWYILQVWHLHMWNIVYIPFCIYIVSYLISIMQNCTYMFNICQTLTFISLLLCTLSLTFAYSYIQVYISAFYPFVCLSNDLLYVTLWHLYPQIVPLVISIRLHVVYILYIGQIFT